MPEKQQNENDERMVDTVELGGVYFNIRTHEIIGFIPAEKLQTEIDVDLIALSVDPHADRDWYRQDHYRTTLLGKRIHEKTIYSRYPFY